MLTSKHTFFGDHLNLKKKRCTLQGKLLLLGEQIFFSFLEKVSTLFKRCKMKLSCFFFPFAFVVFLLARINHDRVKTTINI